MYVQLNIFLEKRVVLKGERMDNERDEWFCFPNQVLCQYSHFYDGKDEIDSVKGLENRCGDLAYWYPCFLMDFVE